MDSVPEQYEFAICTVHRRGNKEKGVKDFSPRADAPYPLPRIKDSSAILKTEELEDRQNVVVMRYDVCIASLHKGVAFLHLHGSDHPLPRFWAMELNKLISRHLAPPSKGLFGFLYTAPSINT